MTTLAWLEDRIGSIVAGRRWILPADVAAATSELVTHMKDWGAADVVVVAAAPGVGDQPDCEVIWTGVVAGSSIMEGIRAFEHAVRSPSEDVSAALDSFDPDRTAMVAAGPFDSGTSMLDRRLYGARHETWAALEDKITIGSLWEAAGVTMAPQEVVPVAEAVEAALRLEAEEGTVWAADNSKGWHGGAEGTRWVAPHPDARSAATDWARGIAHVVRVMPFLDGVPCSIHGYVTDTDVAVFRPIEMIIFRTPDRRFRYGGLSSAWDAPLTLAAEMRAVARTLGRSLFERVGYRGGFSIDGVATEFGFRPTEVNPRLSAGLGMQARAVEGLNIGWVTRGLIEGDICVDHRWIEEVVLDAAETMRSGRLTMGVFEAIDAAEVRVGFEDGRAFVPDDEDAIATLTVGPGPAGPVLFMRFDGEHLPWGERLAPYALAGARLASELWGFELEEMTVAPDRYR